MIAFLYGIESHGTCLLTSSAVRAGVLIKLYPYKGDPVEKSVDRSQGAYKATERPEYECGADDYSDEDHDLYRKHQSRLSPKGFACPYEEESAYRSLGTDEFTESRISHSLLYICDYGEKNDQHDEHGIFKPSQHLKPLHALGYGDLVDQLLDQSEGAEPSAYESSEYRREKKDSTNHIGIDPFFHIAEGLLKGA